MDTRSTNMIQRLPGWTKSELHTARRNTWLTLADPKQREQAQALIEAIDRELEHRSLAGIITRFEQDFPGGFLDKRQLDQEDKPKRKASEKCQCTFGREPFGALIERAEWPELLQNFKRALFSTPLLQASFERVKWLEAVQDPQKTAMFFRALHDGLWGEGALEQRFERYCKALRTLGLAKWTYATYFHFLVDPEHCMFVKPKMLTRSVELAQHWLVYDSSPSGKRYIQILDYCAWLRGRIARLAPRDTPLDMIHVHSFMWFMAPTGKWAEE